MFNDECAVEKNKDPRTMWVFGTPQEKYHKDTVNGVSKGNGTKLIVWECI